MNPNKEPTFINYQPFFNNRESSIGVGLLTLVRNDITMVQKVLDVFPEGKLEIQCVTIFLNSRHIDIINLYNPNQNISSEEFIFYFK